ncbi:MAG TPA: S41 family peptidase, partial [Bacteroidia bacterium]|nr:S41 family peptidase [Bacteroidia bacterium]
LVQQTYPLSYNSLLKVTIAKYYTPSGRCIQALDYSHRSAEGVVNKVADTLINEFRTRNGRSVFDGSGVYPDVYTDPTYYSPLAVALINNFVFFDYANKYFREHASIAPAKEFRLTDSEYEDFVRFVQTRKYDYTDKSERKLEELAKALEHDKHLDAVQGAYDQLKRQLADYKKNDLNNHRTEIKEILEEEIAARYYYQRGRTEADFKYDQEMKKAIEVLMNPVQVASILRGDGPYKVIGKPGSEAYAKAVQERQENEEGDN